MLNSSDMPDEDGLAADGSVVGVFGAVSFDAIAGGLVSAALLASATNRASLRLRQYAIAIANRFGRSHDRCQRGWSLVIGQLLHARDIHPERCQVDFGAIKVLGQFIEELGCLSRLAHQRITLPPVRYRLASGRVRKAG